MVKSKEDKLERDNDQVIVEPVKISNTANETSTKKITDSAAKGATSSNGGKGKEKVVEPMVQDKLQDRISAVATKKSNIPIWFRLVASNQEGTKKPLRQIPSSYIRIKNNNMQISHLITYVIKKLELKSEDEVELYLDNEPLDSSIMLTNLWQYWISTKKDVDIKNLKVGSSAADYVMVINYGRKA